MILFHIFSIGISCTLVCMVLASTPKGKSVNLNLETVLEFDNKNLDSDVKIIDNVQEFLSKVRNVLDKSKGYSYRRSFNNHQESNMKFTDFLEYVINHILTYNDEELEEIAVIIDEEIRKYHYKGCKFYELVENNEEFRDFVTDILEQMKSLRGKKMRKFLKRYLKKIHEKDFKQKDLDLIVYIDSLYRTDSKDKMNNVIKEFEDFNKTTRRTHKNLIKVIRKGLRSIIFDHYSNLNANARRDLKMKVATYFIEYSPENDKKGKSKIKTYVTTTEIEDVPSSKSSKVKKRKEKTERHGAKRGEKTTTERDSLLPTPNRDLEAEKNMMPFRFISLYTEEIPTTTKKPKTTKKKRRKHRHSKKKSVSIIDSSSEREKEPKMKSKKLRVDVVQPKTVMVVREGRPLREILTEHNAIIRVMSSRSPQHVRVKGRNRALRKIKQNRDNKLKKQRHALRERIVDSEAQSTTQTKKQIDFETKDATYKIIASDEDSRKKLKNDSPTDSNVKNKAKLKVKQSRKGKKTNVKDESRKEKQINLYKNNSKIISKKDHLKKSKLYESDTESFIQRARAYDSVVDDYSQNAKNFASDKEDNSRRENLVSPDAEDVTKKTTIKDDRQRKSFSVMGLAIESFENNVLGGFYEFRKRNKGDTFKPNKRSLLRKRTKGRRSRGREMIYRKNLPTYTTKREEGPKVYKKPSKLNINFTKKVTLVQSRTQQLNQNGQQLPTLSTPTQKSNNDTKGKLNFRSQYSGEKIETTTVAYVSDNYIINKIHNLEKQLEKVMNKMDDRSDVKNRASTYNSIENTGVYPKIPYWKGTPRTTRRYIISSSSSSSSEENYENDTMVLSNNKISANVTDSLNAVAESSEQKSDTKKNKGSAENDKPLINSPVELRSKDKTPSQSKTEITSQRNYTFNDTKGTNVDKLNKNPSNSNNTDGRKQGALHIGNTDEIISKKPIKVPIKRNLQTTSLNASKTTSMEKEHTTKSYNKSITAINDEVRKKKNDTSMKNTTSTTKYVNSDKVLKEHSNTEAKTTKKDKYFKASEDDSNKGNKLMNISKPKKDESSTNNKVLKEISGKEAKSTMKDKYFRSSADDPNKEKKSTNRSNSKKDESSTNNKITKTLLDKEAKSTKKHRYFRASEDDPNEENEYMNRSRSKKDEYLTNDTDLIKLFDKEANFKTKDRYFKYIKDDPNGEKKSTNRSNFKKDESSTNDKVSKEKSDEDAKSTEKDRHFRASEDDPNQNIKSKKKRKSRKDKSTTKIENKDKLSTTNSSPTTTCTTYINTIVMKTNESLILGKNFTNINATKEKTGNNQTLIKINTTSTTSSSKSTTISTKLGVKFTFSISNVNISNSNSGNSTPWKSSRRKQIYSKYFDSDNDNLKTDREMDDTLYNWA